MKVKNSVSSNVPANFSEIKVLKTDILDLWYTGTEQTSFMMSSKESELDSNKLVEILSKVYEDEKLQTKFKDLKIEQDLEKLARKIGKEVESLTIDLEGGELIRGYCKLGY